MFPRTLLTCLLTCLLCLATLSATESWLTEPLVWRVPDSGQELCYNTSAAITEPSAGALYYGQDAQYTAYPLSYTNHGDGTVTDANTGLMWEISPDRNGDGIIDANDKMSYAEALFLAEWHSLAGHNDWRVPTIHELYSLMDFRGIDISGPDPDEASLVPFIDRSVFVFGYGDESAGERLIDSQFATTSIYTSTVMNGETAMFGVNFADGRIKGYPTGNKTYYVYLVRGSSFSNHFNDNGDGTITDQSTGLMWQQGDSGSGMDWPAALAHAQQANTDGLLGYSDWRLPNAKELQSIVDYSRSPDATASAAINPLFSCTTITNEGGAADFPFYWTATTHANQLTGASAVYIAFGRALGWMSTPQGYTLMDVHGAGAQRSDPKTGDASDYPYGHGPQGDVIRIENYVRLVRTASRDDRDITVTMSNDFTLIESDPTGLSALAEPTARLDTLHCGTDHTLNFSSSAVSQ